MDSSTFVLFHRDFAGTQSPDAEGMEAAYPLGQLHGRYPGEKLHGADQRIGHGRVGRRVHGKYPLGPLHGRGE